MTVRDDIVDAGIRAFQRRGQQKLGDDRARDWLTSLVDAEGGSLILDEGSPLVRIERVGEDGLTQMARELGAKPKEPVLPTQRRARHGR